MLAGPDQTIDTMKKAVAYTIAALDAASEIDIDRTEEDRTFFAAEKEALEPVLTGLTTAKNQLDDFDLGLGLRYQVRVVLGDAVLDNGLRVNNSKAKMGLKNASGLGADHVFGARVDVLTGEQLRLEPTKVLAAADRLDDVADFPGKAEVKADLTARATKQEELLQARETGYGERNKLKSNQVRVVADAADALIRCKAALEGRFPRQRAYVSNFFADVTEGRRRRAGRRRGTPE